MFKRLISIIIATSVFLTIFVPVSTLAENSLDDLKFFSVDYRTGSGTDLIGGLDPVLTVAPEPATDFKYVQDETLGVQVADFDGTYSAGYAVDYSKLVQDFTVEVYFKLGPDQNGAPWSMVCGTMWMQGDSAVHGFSLNTSSIAINPADGPLEGQGSFIGTKKQFMLTWSTGVGTNGVINDSLAGGKKVNKEAYYDRWVHVVYTHDGTNEALYLDGVNFYNREAYLKEIVHNTSNEMASLFRIGGYNWANNWDMTDMQCAYVNLYSSALSETDVAELYGNRDEGYETTSAPVTMVPGATPIPTPRPEASAGHMSESLFFNVDFDTASVTDHAGNHTYQDIESAMDASDLTYEYDEAIDRSVLVLDGDGMLTWTNDDGETLLGYDLTKGLTMEAFVYIATDADSFKQNMTIIETINSALHLQEYNDSLDLCSGFRCGDYDENGDFDMSNAYIDTTFPHMEWVHIAGVSDGEENRLYINGELEAVYSRTGTTLRSSNDSTTNGIYIGESYFGDMWGPTKFYGKIAFARIYKSAATEEDIAILYNDAESSQSSTVTPGPTTTPDVDFNAEEFLYFDVDFNRAEVTDYTGNYVYQDSDSAIVSDDLQYEYDDSIGRNVLVMNGEGGLKWTTDTVNTLWGYDLTEGITVEAMVYIEKNPNEFKQNMTVFETADGTLLLQEYNNDSDLGSVFYCGDYDKAGNAYVNNTFPRMEWVHIAGVSDGKENRIYINGELKAIYERVDPSLITRQNNGENGIFIGESAYGSTWGATAFYGKIAFVKVYKTALTETNLSWRYSRFSEQGRPSVLDQVIREKTVISDFTASVGNDYECAVYDGDTEVSADNPLGTGMTIVVSDTEIGSVYKKDVIVYGDVTGDGKITSIDYMKTKRAVTDSSILNETQFAAADLNRNGAIQSNDYLKIRKHFTGSYCIFDDM